MEVTHVPTDGWISIHRILFSLKNGVNSDLCYHMDEPWRRYSKWNKKVTQRQSAAWFHLHTVPRAIKVIEKVEWWLSGAWGSCCLTGAEFQFCKVKSAVEMGGGGGEQDDACIYDHGPVYLKMVTVVKVMYIFYHNDRKIHTEALSSNHSHLTRGKGLWGIENWQRLPQAFDDSLGGSLEQRRGNGRIRFFLW